MYEYMTVKASNEAQLARVINDAATEGWEVVGYSIRPTFFIFGFILLAHHFAVLKLKKS